MQIAATPVEDPVEVNHVRLRALVAALGRRPAAPAVDFTGILGRAGLQVEALQLTRQFTAALACAHEIVGKDPCSGDSWLGMARACVYANDRRGTVLALRQAVHHGAGGPECSFLWACARKDDDRALQEALDAAQEALEVYGVPYPDALYLVARIARRRPRYRRLANTLLQRIRPLMQRSVLTSLYEQELGPLSVS